MSFLTRASPISLFPVFLVPPIPFRRSGAVTNTNETTSNTQRCTTTSASNDGYLTSQTSRLRCARCATDLCPTSQIISKGFTGRHGRAFLVSASPVTDATQWDYQSRYAKKASLPNTRTHKAVPRQLVTGAHTVSDVSCAFCGSVIGWKYDAAEEETQRYKVGKYILETKKIFCSSSWEDAIEAEALTQQSPRTGHHAWENSIEFDSQDEDECEDLFAGVWNPALAVRRRQGKRFDRATCEQPSRPHPL
ncbi:MAG: hypothetical protein L6R41_003627 [Letrouitia leprolyta]|nr:MAG: hypothetical protein L6R41_003627 [Letrouitia leprolyta]